MLKNSENNETEEIGLATHTLGANKQLPLCYRNNVEK